MSTGSAANERSASAPKSADAGVAENLRSTAQADRRAVLDRRAGLDRRRGPGRRLTDYRREATEGHMNDEQLAFLMAMEEYKSANNCPFPTWTDVLDVALYLGYRKVAPVGEHRLGTGQLTGSPTPDNDLDA
jgi:hypothetical protein